MSKNSCKPVKNQKVVFKQNSNLHSIQSIKDSLKKQQQTLLKYHQQLEHKQQQNKITKKNAILHANTSFRLMKSQQKRVEVMPESLQQSWVEEENIHNQCRIKQKYASQQNFISKQKSKSIYYPPSCAGYDMAYCKANNSIYVFGGVSCRSELSQGLQQHFFVYHKHQWKEIHPKSLYTPMPRYGHTLTCLNSQLILFGGVSQYKEKLRDRCFYADLWGYNTSKNNWRIIEATGESIKNRKSHAACTYNKYIILHGGIDDSQEVIQQICWGNCQQKKIRIRQKKIEGRFNHKIQVCQSSQGRDYLFVFGGRNKNSEVINEFNVHPIFMQDNQLIIREASKISQVISPRQIPIMCQIDSGILIMGGIGQDSEAKHDIWFYDVEKQCLQTLNLNLDWNQLRGAKGVSTNGKTIYMLPGSTSKKYKAIEIQKKQ